MILQVGYKNIPQASESGAQKDDSSSILSIANSSYLASLPSFPKGRPVVASLKQDRPLSSLYDDYKKTVPFGEQPKNYSDWYSGKVAETAFSVVNDYEPFLISRMPQVPAADAERVAHNAVEFLRKNLKTTTKTAYAGHYEPSTFTLEMREYSDITEAGLTGIIAHELGHALQHASNIGDLYSFDYPLRSVVEAMASRLSEEFIGQVYNITAKSDIADSYQLFAAHYLIDKASGGKLLYAMLNGLKDSDVEAALSDAEKVFGPATRKAVRVEPFDRMVAASMAFWLYSHDKAKYSQVSQSFEEDNKYAKWPVYAFELGMKSASSKQGQTAPPFTIGNLNDAVYQIGLRINGSDRLRMSVFCAFSALMNGVSSPISYQPPQLAIPGDWRLLFGFKFVRNWLDELRQSRPAQEYDNLANLMDGFASTFIYSDRSRKQLYEGIPVPSAIGTNPSSQGDIPGKSDGLAAVMADGSAYAMFMLPGGSLKISPSGVEMPEQYVRTDVGKEGAASSFSLEQNYPNPFNAATTIGYSLKNNAEKVELKVYNAYGQEVKTLVNQDQLAGVHNLNFEGTGLPSGVYFARLTVGNETKTIKMILEK